MGLYFAAVAGMDGIANMAAPINSGKPKLPSLYNPKHSNV
jgi:hypothetical protein